ncbi:hypothetical protein V5F44_04640 [Xanthobacter sp. V2C-8]|uniref:hypothetical protein n=1 Tax=Xanthobacter albus TaxID=3119929 RepID=UPI003728C156
MMRMTPAVLTASLLATLLAAGPALADKPAADRCAAKLPPDAHAIYAASAPKLVPGADGRAVVTEETRKLVLGGQLDFNRAHDAAMAAAGCLMLR